MGQTAEELRGQLVHQRAEIGRDLDAIGDRVSPNRMIERRQAAVRQRVGGIKERLMGAAEGSIDTVRDAGASAHDSASGVVHKTVTVAEGSPLAMGLVAFGAGLVAASLFPATRAERELTEHAQPALEKAVSEAAPAARHIAEEIKPVARDAVADLRDSAKDAVDSVKDQAAESTSETKNEMMRAATPQQELR
jgi:hypothetical protein